MYKSHSFNQLFQPNFFNSINLCCPTKSNNSNKVQSSHPMIQKRLISSSWHLFNVCSGGDVAADNFCNCLKHIIRQCALSPSSYLDNKDMQRSTAVWGERGQGGSVMPPVEAMTASFLPRLQVWPLNSSSFRRSHMSLFVSGIRWQSIKTARCVACYFISTIQKHTYTLLLQPAH